MQQRWSHILNFLCLRKEQKEILWGEWFEWGMGKTTFIILISGCIHCTLLSFTLQTNKIHYKLHYGFTVRGSRGWWTEHWTGGILDLEFSLGVLLPEQAPVSLNLSFLSCKMKQLNSTNARTSPGDNVLHSHPIDKTLLKLFKKSVLLLHRAINKNLRNLLI